MLLTVFQEKLKKANPNLYVKTDERKKQGDNFWISGIYYQVRTRADLRYHSGGLAEIHREQAKYLEALSRGDLDKFITGVCLNHIPEYDIFDFTRSCMLVPGWRKIALRLVKANVCTLAQAKKAFNCTGLGESTYDKMKFFARMKWSKKLCQGEDDAQSD